MPSFPFSIPYPPAGEGYWGPVTSTLDWCEENYYATHYCAEIVNTLTNLWFMYLGVRGIRNVIREKHDRVFLLAYVAYLGIAVGSFAFHASLTYTMQLVDEISMIYSTTILLYASLSYRTSPGVTKLLAISTGTLATGVTVIYFRLGNPVFHQTAFFSITLAVLLRGVYLMEVTLRPRWRKVALAVQGRPERWTNGHGAVVRDKARFEAQVAADREDVRLLNRMYALAGYGTGTALLGFAIWGIDRQFCGVLVDWRRRHLGLPWGVLLEGHGWWHLLTGGAGYINVMWHVWMRYVLYGRRDDVELVWDSWVWSVPEVKKVDHLAGRKRK